MTQQLLAIDSRDRENQVSEDRTKIRVVFQNPVEFREISLIFVDMPNDNVDTESLYYMTIEEVGFGCRGSKAGDESTFIQIKQAPTNYRSLAFENQSFEQTIDLGMKKTFTEFNIKMRYRMNATSDLVISSDYSCMFRINTD